MSELDANAIAQELNVDTSEVKEEALVDESMFDDNGESLFDDFTEDDLVVPEQIIFNANERVEGTILEISELPKSGLIRLTIKITNTDHAGKIHELAMFAPKKNPETGKVNAIKKKQFVQFALTFFTKAQIIAKETDWSQFMGRKIQFTAGKANPYNGRTYQDSTNFELIKDNGENLL